LELAELRANPANWSRFGIYRCAADPRFMVRDRLGLGWTLNMAHPRAQQAIWSVLFGVLAMLGLLLAVVRWIPS
jgi:uncharacterized membrane protein